MRSEKRTTRRWHSSWATAPGRAHRLELAAEVQQLEARALTASIHYVVEPTAVANPNGSVTVSGKIAGLGANQGETINVTVPVTYTVVCTNKGGNIAPGQTHTQTLSGSGTFTSDKNGNIVFSVTTDAPTVTSADCPNKNWTASIGSITYGDATVSGDGLPTLTIPVTTT